MPFSALDRQVLAQLRRDPRTSITDLALRLDLTSGEVRDSIERLELVGTIVGRGWLLGARRPVVALGGAAMDVKMRVDGSVTPSTTHEGRITWEPGGVARNIAEALARLGQPVELVAAIGNDVTASEMIARTRAAGVGTDHLIRVNAPTGIYSSIVDAQGQIFVGAADLRATDLLTVRMLVTKQELIGRAEFIVLDSNLPPVVLGWILDFASAARTPVVLDLVSPGKSEGVQRVLAEHRRLHTLVPRRDELAALLGLTDLPDDTVALTRAASQAHDLGITHVWLNRGPRGSLLSSLQDGTQSVHEFPAPRTKVVDVTGAGDSMTAGYVHSLITRGDVIEAARFGQAVGSLTVESAETVRTDLTDDLVTDRLERGIRPGRRRG